LDFREYASRDIANRHLCPDYWFRVYLPGFQLFFKSGKQMFKSMIPWKRQNVNELVKFDPANELSQFRSNFDRMLEQVWQGEWDDLWNNGWGCDIKDGESEIVVRVEAPGFEPDELDVRISGNRLVLQAEHKTKKESDEGNGSFSSYGKFYRSMTVPAGIEVEQIEASYKNGVLEVHLPKGESARAKRIAVKPK
jgi:HSP20 family protein